MNKTSCPVCSQRRLMARLVVCEYLAVGGCSLRLSGCSVKRLAVECAVTVKLPVLAQGLLNRLVAILVIHLLQPITTHHTSLRPITKIEQQPSRKSSGTCVSIGATRLTQVSETSLSMVKHQANASPPTVTSPATSPARAGRHTHLAALAAKVAMEERLEGLTTVNNQGKPHQTRYEKHETHRRRSRKDWNE